MTRRRFFGYLCLAGFLLMAGAWWHSLDHYSYMVISSPGGGTSINGKLFDGTAAIGVNPSGSRSGSWFVAHAISLRDLGEEARFYREHLDWTDRMGFGEEDMRDLMGGVTSRSYVYHYLYLPLWFIYLTFVVVTFLLLRPMRKQRLLEEQATIPSNSPSEE